ncbi:MAG TPA: CoA-binding protein [Planctomycetaceae bacterium]|nr:CoA-binding protein [Planctomycetaceae bacterium]
MNIDNPTPADARKTVAVIGASPNRRKYGNKSVRAHLAQGWRVFPVHPTAEQVEGLTVYPTLAAVPVGKLDRITVYVPPQIGIGLLADMAAKHPGEVWLNPGAESDALVARAEALGLPVIQACSIVDLGVRPSQFAD